MLLVVTHLTVFNLRHWSRWMEIKTGFCKSAYTIPLLLRRSFSGQSFITRRWLLRNAPFFQTLMYCMPPQRAHSLFKKSFHAFMMSFDIFGWWYFESYWNEIGIPMFVTVLYN